MELYNNKYKVCTSLTVFVATSREMKSTDCRLNLIKATCVMHGCQKHQKGRDIYRLLLALVGRTAKISLCWRKRKISKDDIETLQSKLHLCKPLFSKFKKNRERLIVGMFSHVISHHLPDMLRLVNGKSIVAEAAERNFNKLQWGELNKFSTLIL